MFPEQSRVVEQAIQNDCGVIVAPSGSGKTIIGLALVAQRSLPALILVHRKQLLDQPKTFRHVVSELNPRYLYGLTATPKRKHNDEPLIYAHIGDIVAGIKTLPPSSSSIQDTPTITEICIRETSLAVPFKFSTDNFQLLSKIICFDTARNQLIIKDIQEQVAEGKKVLLLSERRDHIDILNLYLKGLCETIQKPPHPGLSLFIRREVDPIYWQVKRTQ